MTPHISLSPKTPPAPRPSPTPRAAATRASGITLGRLVGVQVHVDWSLLFIFALVTFNLGAGLFPRWHPTWSAALCWGTALGAALLFFASVLAHELAHAVVARRKGIPVSRITLFLFGGVAAMEGEPPSPAAEFWMAIVGPLTSLAIGIVATLAGSQLAGSQLAEQTLSQGFTSANPALVEEAFRTAGPVATLLLWLGPINLLLAVFNMIPGFPLDGGRVLRSLMWWWTSDLSKATRWAAGAGQVLAWSMMGLGVMNLFSGALVQGLWFLLLGWFLNQAARASYQNVLLRRSLSNVSVASVMRTNLDRVSPQLALDAFVRDHVIAADQHAFPVEAHGDLLGLVCPSDLRKVAQASWPAATVGDIMTPAQALTSLPPEAPAEQALDALARQDVDQIPVLDGMRLLGLVRRGDLFRLLTWQ